MEMVEAMGRQEVTSASNHALHRTARELRSRVPSSLRSSAAGERKR
jgi:hypothetical protein